MLYRPLGRTGIDVSILGFGCMRLPTLGAPDRIDAEKASEMLHYAIDHGVNYVDTAYFYHSTKFGEQGASEPFVGEALSGGWRERVQLATKLPQQIVKERDDFDRFLEGQLKHLKTDHIDFYLVHGINGSTWDRVRAMGVIDFLEGARDQGMIRFPAFSFHGPAEDFPRIIDEYDGWAFGQLQYNYVDTEFQAGYAGLRHAADKGIGVVVMEPLKGGKLANIPDEMRPAFDARTEGWSPAEWALRYVWNEPGVSLLLSGMGTLDQVKANIASAEGALPGSLTDEQLAVLADARRAIEARTKVDCSACRYCLPCPAGVDIPGCFASLNAAHMWDDANPFTTGYTLVQGKASACEECGQCEDMCPQGLPIRELLKEVSGKFGQ